MRNVSMIAAVGTGVGVIGLLSLPSISSLALQLSKREPKEDLYEDADGKSTPESVKAYSAKWPKAAILALAFIGCATAIAVAVLTTLHSSQHELSLENWLSAAAWVSLSRSWLWLVVYNSELIICKRSSSCSRRLLSLRAGSLSKPTVSASTRSCPASSWP